MFDLSTPATSWAHKLLTAAGIAPTPADLAVLAIDLQACRDANDAGMWSDTATELVRCIGGLANLRGYVDTLLVQA